MSAEEKPKAKKKFSLGKIFGSVAIVYAATLGAIGCKLENPFPQTTTPPDTTVTQVDTTRTTPPVDTTSTTPDTTAAPSLAELIAAADVAQGEKLAKVCGACHSFNQNSTATMLGPNLHGVIGRERGSVEGYAYSPAMKAKGGNWTEENLDTFLKHPTTAVPGTKMPYAGMKEAKDRAAVIKWLETLKQ